MRLFDSLMGERLLTLTFRDNLSVAGVSHFLPVSPQVAQGQTGEMCRSPLTFSFYACRI